MYWGAFEGQREGRLWYFIFWLVWRRRARKGAGLPSRRIKARIICFPVFYTPPHPHFLKGLLLYFPDESTRPKQRFEGHHGLLWKKRHFEGHKRLLLFGKKELDNIFAIYILTIKIPYRYVHILVLLYPKYALLFRTFNRKNEWKCVRVVYLYTPQ